MPESLQDRESPRHSPWMEQVQFRAKLQEFTHTGPLLTVRQVDFGEANDRMMTRYRRALPFTRSGDVVSIGTKRPRNPDALRSPEDLERSRRRSVKLLRDSVRELCPEGMLTLTARNRLVDLDTGRRVVARFLRSLKPVCPEFAAVVVPEKNASGPCIHFHLAYRGIGDARWNTLRRLWHSALLAEDGKRALTLVRGTDAPGNIDVKDKNGSNGIAAKAARVGRYMSKYLSKDLDRDWGTGRKAFTTTENVTIKAAQRYYLDALNPTEALAEALERAGYDLNVLRVHGVNVWHPPESNVWVIDLARHPAPS